MSYVLNTEADRKTMLEKIGAASLDSLFQPIPDPFKLKRPLAVPPALSEMELEQHLCDLAAKNQSADRTVCFLGGGSYDHYIPSVVDAVSGRSEFYTAYTPYQAEASQGSLQAFFEYQTMICELTGLDVSNASLYEGGSAVAESVLMSISIDPDRPSADRGSVHPEHRQTLETYMANIRRIVTLPTPNGTLDLVELKKHLDDKTLCVIVQHPNFFGSLEEVDAISKACKEKGALFVVSFDAISLGLMKRPGQYGADIAIGEGQCLGNPMVFGGPYLGMMACKEQFLRKIPGRLVGQTVDRNNKRCWALTLQTREQHIRREKATSKSARIRGLCCVPLLIPPLGPQGQRRRRILLQKRALSGGYSQDSRRVAQQEAVLQGIHIAGARRRAALLERLQAGFTAVWALGR